MVGLLFQSPFPHTTISIQESQTRYYLYVKSQYTIVSTSSHMPLKYHSTFKNSHKCVQIVAHKYSRIRLPRKACLAIAAKQREAVCHFRAGVQGAWAGIDKSAKTLAATHHKSVRYVQTQLYMGCQKLWTKRKKSSLWNAFMWKKGNECRNTESKSTFSTLTCFHSCSYRNLQMHPHRVENSTSATSPRSITPSITLF